ncbi:hypothetical protein D9613_007745 [Agrocybe pediades]|uniref:Uncharacterized protein n=1 Tax=Agrocybe pediades TaxID=84607 RepID=A0A8H4VKV4_9AGAR|nr:hypothetical protein D9613_007745 [Agrocybe pediades]
MFSTLFTVALFVAPAIQGVFADFAINSPQLTQCKESTISWEPTKAPYNLIVVRDSDQCGDALVEVGDFNKTSISWKANIKAGTKVVLSLVDADDNEAWSKTITVAASDDSSCLGTSSASSASASAPAGSSSVANFLPSITVSSDTSAQSDTANINPVGAANAGTNPFSSGAITVRQASTPLLALAGLVAAVTLL